MSYLKDLVWNTVATGGVSVVETQGAGIFYRILQVGSVIEVNWDNQIKGKGDKRGGFKTFKDAKDFVELDHYPHTMKPYVKGFEVIEQKVNSINEVNNKGKDMETLQGNTKKYSKEQVVSSSDALQIQNNSDTIGNHFTNFTKWANDRKIIENGNILAQGLKLVSEVGELSDNLAKGLCIKDDVGDCMVVLNNLAQMQGLTLDECLEQAWGDIKDRKGYMNEYGVFIKE